MPQQLYKRLFSNHLNCS